MKVKEKPITIWWLHVNARHRGTQVFQLPESFGWIRKRNWSGNSAQLAKMLGTRKPLNNWRIDLSAIFANSLHFGLEGRQIKPPESPAFTKG